MKSLKSLVELSKISISVLVVFASIEAAAKFLPDNDMYIGPKDVTTFDTSITEQRFNEIISDVTSVYAPIISQMGGRLNVNRLWNSGEVNAFAHRNGNTWSIDIHGGLARHPAVTEDALALVVCHEIGHHIGGAPKFTSGNLWASIEGQADYFAGLKCLRKVYANENNKMPGEDPVARQKCEESFGLNTNADLCTRIVMAGQSAVKIFTSTGPDPHLDTPDPSQVSHTFESHPQPQCRLDTYLAGALCGVEDSEDVSQTNPLEGTCHRGVANIVGYRPLCWYKPASQATEIADKPKLNGQEQLQLSNPNTRISLNWDVRGFEGAAGVYLEVSKPNTPFSNPNGVAPDPNALGGDAFRGLQGSLPWTPNQLPGWGTYYIRVIPLDSTGRIPVGKFSDPSVLILQPARRIMNRWRKTVRF